MQFIAKTQRITPINKDPESPIKILAGEKLKIKLILFFSYLNISYLFGVGLS